MRVKHHIEIVGTAVSRHMVSRGRGPLNKAMWEAALTPPRPKSGADGPNLPDPGMGDGAAAVERLRGVIAVLPGDLRSELSDERVKTWTGQGSGVRLNLIGRPLPDVFSLEWQDAAAARAKHGTALGNPGFRAAMAPSRSGQSSLARKTGHRPPRTSATGISRSYQNCA